MGLRAQDPADPYDIRPPKPRLPHPIPIRTAAMTADGAFLVALDAEGAICGWNVKTNRLRYRRPLVGKDEVPQRLTCSPDGRYLAASARHFPGSVVRVVDLATGTEVRRFERGFSPVFSPDGEILAAADGPTLRRWAMKSGAQLPALEAPDLELKWVAFSPPGDRIAVSVENSGEVFVWELATRRRTVFTGGSPWGAATGIAFSPHGKILAIGSAWGVRFWDPAGEELDIFSHEEYARGQLRFSRDGNRMIASIGQTRVLVWDLWKRRPLFTWGAFMLPHGLIEVSEAGDQAIWIEKGGIRIERFPAFLGGEEDGHVVRCIGFTAEGHAITGDNDGALRLWDPVTQKEVRRFAVPKRNIHAFTEDAAWAIFGGGDEAVSIWDFAAGKEVFLAHLKPFVNAIALSPDRSTLALGHSDGSVSLWDVATVRERCRIQADMAGISALAWSPNGKTLAWGDEAGTVVLADGTRGAEPLKFKPRSDARILELKFDADGKSVIAIDKSGVRRRYWDKPGVDPTIAEVVPLHPRLDDRWNASGFSQKRWQIGIADEAVSRDRSYVISSTTWGTALIWEAPGGK